MNYTEQEKLYMKACEAYALGEPILSDKAFDELEEELRVLGSKLVDLVSEDFLDEGEVREVSYETFSIKEAKTWAHVKEFFKAYPDCTFVATLKFDGICTKLGIDPKGLLSQSRNRGSRTALDFTKTMQTVLGNLKSDEPITITGESFVPWEDLETLRDTYNKDKYVMPRSAAISLLRTPDVHKDEHIRLMKFKAFHTDKPFDTYAESLDWLVSEGYDVPKYEVFSIEHSRDIEEQLNPILDLIDTGEPSDGVVIQVNERGSHITNNIDGKYMSTQMAFKMGKWAGEDYKAEVIGLNIGRAKGNKGVTLQIKPFITRDNSRITKVNAYNMGIIQRNKIRKGSIIEFVRVSNNMCNLVYK